MGRGRIVSHIADGEYWVELDLDDERAAKRIKKLENLITQLEDELERYQNNELKNAQDAYDVALTELDAAIASVSAPYDEDERQTIIDAQQAISDEKAALDAAQRYVRQLKADIASKEQQVRFLKAHYPENETVRAWCADLTTDLSGEVGTIEVPGERGTVQIRPGYDDSAAYDQNRDGKLQPALSSTPAGTFWNWAMQPGWQKWMPTYRYGVIDSFNGDGTADLVLSYAKSSNQALGVNAESRLFSVPFDYMGCDDAAFSENDVVLVKFEGYSWDNPVVIGFAEEPSACPLVAYDDNARCDNPYIISPEDRIHFTAGIFRAPSEQSNYDAAKNYPDPSTWVVTINGTSPLSFDTYYTWYFERCEPREDCDYTRYNKYLVYTTFDDIYGRSGIRGGWWEENTGIIGGSPCCRPCEVGGSGIETHFEDYPVTVVVKTASGILLAKWKLEATNELVADPIDDYDTKLKYTIAEESRIITGESGDEIIVQFAPANSF